MLIIRRIGISASATERPGVVESGVLLPTRSLLYCPNFRFSQKNVRPKVLEPSLSFIRFSKINATSDRRVISAAASAAGSSNSDGDINPYEVLGVSAIEGFDMIKAAYTKKRKEAERSGDEAAAARLEKAYDRVMMAQLSNRKKGVTFGSFKTYFEEIETKNMGKANAFASLYFSLYSLGCVEGRDEWEKKRTEGRMVIVENNHITDSDISRVVEQEWVSKDIKYADKQPIVPWGPRFSKSSENDIRINLAISAVFTAWILVKRSAEYKPLQFLAFAFVYRLFEKLKSFELPTTPTYNEDGEDTGQALRMGKRLLRSLALVFGCIAVSSLAYTGLLNFIEFSGGFIPALLYNNQIVELAGRYGTMQRVIIE
ncbi:Protein CHAPERONE-LIKE PROTEIN OF POR1-like [Senna tora]|uniref:Protein CHAPERONE-LIKE PROTEIN OF POR1-like n=1 Tax=Senna tora TaxID=362788 RepID=A0A834T9X0_9FABA|nr:Protein CHAPERONE-LIKE PROTEIN OF POR1-like [Senna tora]